jgi:hypothetical protein
MEFDDYYHDLDECNYDYWLKHDLVTIVQISCIATGYEPIDPKNFFNCKSDYRKQHEIFELLLNGLELRAQWRASLSAYRPKASSILMASM